MAKPAGLRASDADRERVAEVLRDAAGEGRLATDELEHRLGAAFAARTYGDLDGLIADLPGPPLAMRSRSRDLTLARAALAVAAVPLMLALIIAVVFAVTGVLALWMFWVAAGWWFFGHRRRRSFAARDARMIHPCDGWHRSGGGARGFWV